LTAGETVRGAATRKTSINQAFLGGIWQKHLHLLINKGLLNILPGYIFNARSHCGGIKNPCGSAEYDVGKYEFLKRYSDGRA
jgi:hypothetical protein